MTSASRMKELALVFLKLSLLGFGGPNAHLALMQTELIERRRWLDREHFLQILALTNLLPGPNSSEVAIHVGYLRRGILGGIVAGTCFVMPTLLLVIASAHIYFHYGQRMSFGEILAGIKPAVIGLIVVAGLRLGRHALRDPLEVALCALGGTVVIVTPRWELPALALGLLVGVVRNHRRPSVERGAGALLALLWLCFSTGAVLFGGGYMVVPLLHDPVVVGHGWLSEAQFLDGIALSHGLPGPITTFVAFIGTRVAGPAGGVCAVAAIYLPAFLAVFLAAPWLARARRAARISALLRGVNAVVTGTLLGAAVSLARSAIPSAGAVLIFVAATALLLLKPGLNVFWIVAGAAVLGLALL